MGVTKTEHSLLHPYTRERLSNPMWIDPKKPSAAIYPITKNTVSESPSTVSRYVEPSMDFLSALLFVALLIITLAVALVILIVVFTIVFALAGVIHNKIKGKKLAEIEYKW